MPESDASRSEFKLIPSESTALGEVLPIPAPRYEPTTEMDYRKIAPPPGWDSLSDDAKTVYARQMEVYATLVESADHEVGRLFDAIENLGELDNTLFIYISGDNGGSSIGDINGVFVEWVPLNNAPEDIPLPAVPARRVRRPRVLPDYLDSFGSSSRMTGGRCRIPLVEPWPFALVRGRRTPQAILAESSSRPPGWLGTSATNFRSGARQEAPPLTRGRPVGRRRARSADEPADPAATAPSLLAGIVRLRPLRTRQHGPGQFGRGPVAGDVIGPALHLGRCPLGPLRHERVEVGQERAREQGGGAALLVAAPGLGEAFGRSDVVSVHLDCPGPGPRNRFERVGPAAVIGEHELDQPLELEHRPVAGLGKPGGQGSSAGGCDRVDGPPAPPDRLLARPGVAVLHELLGLFEQLALGARPHPADAEPHRLGQLVRRVWTDREQPEDAVCSRGEHP